MKYPRVKLDSIKADGRYAFVGGPFGSNLTTRDYVEEGVPVIRGSNQSSVSIFHDDDYVFVSEEKAVQLTSNLAFPGDIIFTQRGTLGQVGVIPQNAKYDRYVISQSQMKLAVHPEKAEAMYVYYYFRRPDIVQTIINLSQSSGVPHINLGTLKNFEIPLPSIDIQRRIISTLSAYDDLIENNRRRIDLLEQSARLLYKEWFISLRFPGHEHVKVKDGIPQGWEKGVLSDFFDTTSGGTPSRSKPEYYLGDINWAKTQELNENFLFDTEEKITEEAINKSSAKLFPEHTLLVSIYGGTNIGRTCILARPSASNQACVALFPLHPSANPLFAQLFIQSIRNNLIGMSQGAAQTNISQQVLRQIEMTMPDKKIMQLFLEYASPLFEQKKILEHQTIKLTQARDLLLPRLTNGEISV